MKCLELLGILRSFIEKGEGILTAALQHVSALPVQLLRQVSLKPMTIATNSKQIRQTIHITHEYSSEISKVALKPMAIATTSPFEP